MFTGKERDAESGLDYFGARYFSGAQGRFTSPDPLLNSGRPWEPQSWNRYSYTLNNPLHYNDPTGLYEWDATLGGGCADKALKSSGCDGFTSPDPEGASASLFDPQRWNAYSYAVNNPYKFVDPDGEVPVLLVTAGIGAGVGAVGGAVFDVANQLIQNGGDFSAINGREVAGAAIGGAVSGGIAGLTLGLIPAPAVLTTGYLATTAVVSGGANVAGGIVQRAVDPNASGSATTDFVTGAVGGAVGTKVAYVRYPLPNVKKELAIIANSNRRSLRPQKVAAFNQYANQQMIRNTTVGAVTGTSVTNFLTNLWSDVTSFFTTQKSKPDPEKDRQPSHAGCLIDRSTGNCVQ